MKKPVKLDRVTEAIAGAWFGMMRPGGDSHLHFGLKQGRPSIAAERALNVLEAKGLVSRTPDEFGGMTYRPLVDMSGYFAAARNSSGIKLTETINE